MFYHLRHSLYITIYRVCCGEVGIINLTQVVLLAVFAESIWETLKMLWEKDKLCVDRLGALVTGVVLAVGTGTDFFALLGLPVKIPYLGLVCTGIIASRGANFLHDILKITEKIKINNSAQT